MVAEGKEGHRGIAARQICCVGRRRSNNAATDSRQGHASKPKSNQPRKGASLSETGDTRACDRGSPWLANQPISSARSSVVVVWISGARERSPLEGSPPPPPLLRTASVLSSGQLIVWVLRGGSSWCARARGFDRFPKSGSYTRPQSPAKQNVQSPGWMCFP